MRLFLLHAYIHGESYGVYGFYSDLRVGISARNNGFGFVCSRMGPMIGVLAGERFGFSFSVGKIFLDL